MSDHPIRGAGPAAPSYLLLPRRSLHAAGPSPMTPRRCFSFCGFAVALSAASVFLPDDVWAGAPNDPAAAGNHAAVDPAATISFERQIRPILRAHCLLCHGESDPPEGSLDLRLRKRLVEGGDSGAAIVPGDRQQSLLFGRLVRGEMPPGDHKPTSAEIETIGQWIDAGAPTLRDETDDAAQQGVTPEDRDHWAFQPLMPPDVPAAPAGWLIRTPVDAFVAQRLAEKQLRFSGEADKLTLIKRATLDLWGLPPTPHDVEQFLSDTDDDAYDRLIDRLLASANYGQRWARHWLDVAGYADSDGYTSEDRVRPYAYRYRDYVIRALNDDKPFDQFVREQLAGDEMVAPPYWSLAPQQLDKLLATGFLRMAADGTASGGVDQDMARNQVLSDTIKIVSTSLMGLTVGCAQCHDHRYDPIPQADYYRLRAVFEPALDWKNWRTPDQRLVSLYTDADRAKAAELETQAAQVVAERQAKQDQYMAEALARELEKFPAENRDALRAAAAAPADQRTPEQTALLDMNPSLKITPGVLYQYNQAAADELKKFDARINEIRAQKPVEDFVHVLTEPNDHAPTTFLFHRGDPQQPKDAVLPGDLTIAAPAEALASFAADDPALPTTGRRTALARWLTQGQHPLLGRALVNRVWLHHFGRGLVNTPGDFGRMGEAPSHPELLDWLAVWWADEGWSLKALHKLVMTSTVYRQSSQMTDMLAEADPENRWYARMSVRRLEAEAIRDRILATAGTLNAKMFGPATPVREDATGQIVVGQENKVGANMPGPEAPLGDEAFRRSIYVLVRRSQPLGMLRTFDAPLVEASCERRVSSTVATQSLLLMNSQFLQEQAGYFAQRLRREAPGDRVAQTTLAWKLAHQRPPTVAETALTEQFLQQQVEFLNHQPPADPAAAPADHEWGALTNLCQALLSSNEFLYVD